MHPFSRAHLYRRRPTRVGTLLAALAGSAALALSLVTAAPASAATGDVASDQFTRTTTASWGSATTGGQWTGVNTAVLATGSGAGIFRLKPSAFALNTLPAAPARDTSVSFSFWSSALPAAGNGVTTSAVLRARDGRSYQARARITASGTLTLKLSRYDGSTAKETSLVGETVVARGVVASDRFTIEFSATGTTEVALSARAWKTGTAAPAWQLTHRDASALRIADAGATGVGAYLSSSTAALDLRVDDFTAGQVSATTPTPTPTPTSTPTPTPTTSPTTAPVDPAVPAPGAGAGSAAVGTTSYTVPAGALYVAAKGTATGSGTLVSPYGSLAHAIAQAPSGATLVLRAGTYHESVTIPLNKKLIVQAHPREAVWLDGSSTVTGWQQSGSTWSVSGWKHAFDRRVSFTKGVDETSRWTDSTNPYAGYPDQVWINGVALRQVGSASQVTSGKFFVDTAQQKLVIGSDPTGKTVQASTLQKAMTIAGTGSTVRGIGIRRYATSVHQMGAVTAEVPRITLENLVISQNAATGLYAWADDHVFRSLTVSSNGLMGIGANKADRLRLSRSLITGNNTERFKPAPVSGGMKVTASYDVVIEGSRFTSNTTNGLWFDMSAYNTTITGNAIDRNGRYGLVYEASAKALLAGNTFTNTGHTALMIHNAGSVQVWNNTFSANARSLWFMQDERRQTDAALVSTIPWVVKDITMRNNVMSFGTGNCPILTQDTTLRWYGNDFGVNMDSNLYHRAYASSPANVACWANGPAGTRSFKTLDEFRAHTGRDAKSRLLEGTSPLASSLGLTDAARTLSAQVATAIPSSVAARIGAPAGSLLLGAVTPRG